MEGEDGMEGWRRV